MRGCIPVLHLCSEFVVLGQPQAAGPQASNPVMKCEWVTSPVSLEKNSEIWEEFVPIFGLFITKKKKKIESFKWGKKS